MRVPLTWLREWVNFPWDAAQLADRLTGVGLEVAAIDRPGNEVRGVIVARIDHVSVHPENASLRVCTLATGGAPAAVVTAAHNGSVGDLVVYAPPGAHLAGGVTIGRRDFGPVTSVGMLCSGAELGLGAVGGNDRDRAAGLLILPRGLDARPGDDVGPILGLGEDVLTLELTPNYAAHCQSIYGVAREVAALTAGKVQIPAVPTAATDPRPAAELVTVNIDRPDDCSRYVARVIDGVQIGPSPLWLQRRLQLCGMRPINNVVDVTNYVMLELGQPLHGFDLERLAGSQINVRRAAEGEDIRTLDGEERALTAADLVIADAERPVAIAGVMGGADSEVEPATRTIMLEAAHFDAARVRETSRRLGLRTEASLRFEKGLDPQAAELASQRAATLIAAYAGGRVLAGAVTATGRTVEAKILPLNPDRINQLLGTKLSRSEIAAYLSRYGFNVQGDRVHVPSHRTDVAMPADLAEEVARLHGYDRIDTVLPVGAPAATGRPRAEKAALDVRRYLVACGFSEVVTFSFAPSDLADRLRLPDDHPQRRPLQLANPMGADQACLRSTLLGSMLDVMQHNVRHGQENLALFEIGTTYRPHEAAGAVLPDERQHLLLAVSGRREQLHWQRNDETADVFVIKGVLERLALRLGVDLSFQQIVLPFLHPGRAAVIHCEQHDVGYLGQLHPELVEDFELPESVCVAEVNLSALLGQRRTERRYRQLPRFPAVQRDVAFIVPNAVAAVDAAAVIRRFAGDWLRDVQLFDVYDGKGIAPGHRSLAFTLEYRAEDRTLTDGEVDQVHAAVRDALVRELGAVLR